MKVTPKSHMEHESAWETDMKTAFFHEKHFTHPCAELGWSITVKSIQKVDSFGQVFNLELATIEFYRIIALDLSPKTREETLKIYENYINHR